MGRVTVTGSNREGRDGAMPWFAVACLVSGALAAHTTAAAEAEVLTVPTETFRAAAADAGSEAAAEPEPRTPLPPSLTFRLPRPTRTEMSRVRGADDADDERPRLPVQQVGFGRNVRQLAGGALDRPALLWQPTVDGGQATALAVASEGAKGLRVRLVIESAPPGLEVRVYDAAGTPATVAAVPAHQLRAGERSRTRLWTPTVPGDATTVELYLPPGTEPGELKVSIPALSHLDGDLTPGIIIGRPSLCAEHTDVACAAHEISDVTRRAVAKYVFTTSSGHTSGCTGTLLNDTDPETQIPYFLTADHCVENQQEASSMEFYWFYERERCGGPNPEGVKRQAGGATVLARAGLSSPDTGVDHALVRLNSDPPDGVAMAGWTTASAAAGDTAVGVHHPLGALKKLARHSVTGFSAWWNQEGSSHIDTRPDVNLQPGSSGSGLWKRIDGADYLVGVATGGTAGTDGNICTDAENSYGRFDRFYPKVSRWLGEKASLTESEIIELSRLALVDAATRAEVADLTGGDAVVDLAASAVRSFDIVAELSAEVGAVALTLAGPRSAVHASDFPPYSAFGPAGGGGLVAGSYRLDVVAYRHGQRGTGGEPVLKRSVAFEVTGSAGDDRAVTGLAFAVGGGPRIIELADGAAVTVYAGEPVEVRARTSGGGAVGSVAFAISGAGTLAATTNDVPFAVPATLTTGTYRITATPHAAADGGGEAGTALAVTGVTVTVAPAPVTGFALVDASGGLPDPDIGPLADAATVDLSAHDGWTSVRAELASSTGATRVALVLDGPRHVAQVVSTDGVVSLFGESGGDYVAGAFPDGAYTLAATPYAGPEPRDALPGTTVTFTVTGGYAGAVSGFTLIDAGGGPPDPDFAAIADGATVSLADTTDRRVSIRAELAYPEAAVSVRLELRGPVAVTRTSDRAPHLLFGATADDVHGGKLPDGTYTLTARPFSEAEGSGEALPVRTVTFTLADSGWEQTLVSGFTLIDAAGESPHPTLGAIGQDATIPWPSNRGRETSIRADLASLAGVGSVRLRLSGPVRASRIEGNDGSPFTIFGDNVGEGLISGRWLPRGRYTIEATPLSGRDGSGTDMAAQSATFTLSAADPGAASVTGFTLVDAGATPAADVGAIAANGTVDVSSLTDGVGTVRVEIAPGRWDVRSVVFELRGPRDITRTDNGPPFSLFGDDDAGERAVAYAGNALPNGSYVLTARPYDAPDAVGAALVSASVAFTLSGSHQPDAAPVTAFTLLDAGDGVAEPDLGTLADGATLDLSSTATGLIGLRAELAARRPDAKSVVLELRGPKNVDRTLDAGTPWRLFDAGGSALPNGMYTLTATPYTDAAGGGDALPSTTVTFTVTGSFDVGDAPVTGFTLVDAANGLPDPDLGPLADGAEVNLSATGGLASVRAELAARRPDVEKVLLTLHGPRSVDRGAPARAPMSLFGDSGGDYVAGGFPRGDYTLTAHPAGPGDLRVHNFDDGAAGWAPGGRFRVTDGVYEGMGGPGFLADFEASDLVIAADVRPPPGAYHGGVLFGATDSRRYLGLVRSRVGEAAISRMTHFQGGGYRIDTLARVRIDAPGPWYRVKVVTEGSRIELHVDGVPVVELEDPTYTGGGAGMWSFLGGGLWDNVVALRRDDPDDLRPETAVAFTVVSGLPSLSIEAGEPVTEGGTAAFTITADQAPAADLAVAVAVTQRGGEDYLPDTLPTSVTIAAGATEAALAVALPDDDTVELDGVVTATISESPMRYHVTTSSASLAVRDNDRPGLSIAAGPAATEGGAATFTITADRATTADLAVAVSVTQGADDDYLPGTLPSSVTIAAGATEATLSVSLPDDEADEPDGVITATIGASPEYRVTVATASLVVRDNDDGLSALSIAAGAAATEGGTATFTITADPAPAADLLVALSVTQGVDDDYLPDALPTAGTIAAGATKATVSVALPDDAVEEPDGVIVATIGASPEYRIAVASASLAVHDNDVPTLSIAAGETATEGGTATFTITADQAPAADLAVPVAVTQEGSHLGGGWRRAPKVRLARGALQATLTIPLPDDDVVEPHGAIVATILGSRDTVERLEYHVAVASARVVVLDDDVPALSITAGEAATEGGTATFTITADQAPAADLVVAVSVTQGAGDDYLPDTLPTSVTIANGATEANLLVTLPDDDAVEPDGMVTATIAESSDYDVTTSSASLAVHDNDVPALSIAAGEAATEGGTATFTITANSAPLAELAVTVSVTQGPEDDYLPDTLPTSVTIAAGATVATLSVALPDDAVDEPDGVLTATLASGSGYVVSETAGSASLNVRDDDVPSLSIAAGEAATEGGVATFTITAEPAPAADLAVTVSVTQGAADDYLPDTLPSAATIMARTTVATLLVTLPDDAVDEPDGTVTVTIAASSDYDVTTSSASLTVRDNDVSPVLSIAAGAAVTEGGTATFTVTADQAPTVDLAVSVSVTQGADDDYLPDTPPTSVTLAAEATAATLSVAVPDDEVHEPDGVVTAALTAGAGYEVSATAASASVTVRDDDPPPLEAPSMPFALAIPADRRLYVSWEPGEDGGPVEAWQYSVIRGVTGSEWGPWIELPVEQREVTVRDLENGVSWLVAFRGVNADAEGEQVGTSATPRVRAPTAVTATAAHARVQLAWRPHAHAAPDVPWQTRYAAEAATPAERQWSEWTDAPGGASARGVAVTGLVHGTTYVFEVRGVSSAGVSSEHDVSKPVAVTATLGLPALSITAGATVTEGGTATFTITTDQAPVADLAVSVSVTQGADDDYLPDTLPTSVTIAAGATTATVSVALPDDDTVEADGVITATIAASSGYDITMSSASVTVQDNDVPSLSIAAGEAVTEGDTATFTITADQAPAADLAVTVSVTQGADDDYLPDTLPTAVTIAAGATAATLSVMLPDDETVEPDGTVTATIAASSDYDVTVASASVTVQDDDAPELTAEFRGVPKEHWGKGFEFEFELLFSEFLAPLASATLREEALQATNATVTRAKRVVKKDNRHWTITVRPDARADVTVTLPATTDCEATGALCTEDGRPLSNSLSATVAAAAPLTAEFVGLPESHDGRSPFEFELRFSEDFPGRLPYTLLRDEAFRVEHGTVLRAGRVEQGRNQRWTIEVRPESHEALTIELPAVTDCSAAGAVCSEAGRPLSSTVSATVKGPPPLTAEFVDLPESHDGKSLFEFELRFSEDFPGPLPYTMLRDEAIRVENGTVHDAARVDEERNQRWTIEVRPDSHEAVTIELPATTDCAAAGAVCTEAGRPLSNSLSATVAGLPPLTAEFVDMPDSHDGESDFEFELRFSRDFPGRLPFTLLRDDAFEVENGTVQRARRFAPEQNQRWMISVQPDSHEDVTIKLPATTDCTATAAVCTEAGRPLSNLTSATVAGPRPAARADGPVLTLVWPTPRDGFAAPGGKDFAVRVDGGVRPVTSASLWPRGVVLELAEPVQQEQAVALDYLGSAMHPLRDAAGNAEPAWRDLPVVNMTGEGDGLAVPVGDAGLLPVPDGLSASFAGQELGDANLAVATLDPGVRRLDLSGNALTDIAALAALATLQSLDLSDNALVDLAPLRGLTALRRLDLGGNDIAALWPLAELPHLEVLLLDGNRVADLGALTHMTGLEHLDLAGNAVADLSPLADLSSLRRLDLGRNPARDLSPVGDLDRLVWLRLPDAGGDAPAHRLVRLRWLLAPDAPGQCLTCAALPDPGSSAR